MTVRIQLRESELLANYHLLSVPAENHTKKHTSVGAREQSLNRETSPYFPKSPKTLENPSSVTLSQPKRKPWASYSPVYRSVSVYSSTFLCCRI